MYLSQWFERSAQIFFSFFTVIGKLMNYMKAQIFEAVSHVMDDGIKWVYKAIRASRKTLTRSI